MRTHYLACDLGAESGRLMLGTLADGRLTLEEVHRFPNTPLRVDGSLHWDISALFEELKIGFKKAAARQMPISSISTDSWGVDYLLFDSDGSIIPPTFHYRDPRTARGVEQTFAKIKWENIFAETGIQFMPLNTIFQLAAESGERLERAALLLGIGDGFNYMLSGIARAEESLASTFQLYNPRSKDWSEPLLKTLALPRKLFPEIVPSGTRLGVLLPKITRETGLSGVNVVASCSHDTAAAVAAVPADERSRWAYISSGTWSLMGVELHEPIINDECRELNFTNEIGYGGTVRLLKNIVGLWLIQECRRDWAQREQQFDYATLMRLAGEAPPFQSLIEPADARFISADEMPAKIAGFCRETHQAIPNSPGAFIRCALESLALLYRRTLQQIERLIGHEIEQLHIVGGGSRNSLLNQFTASALQIPVLAGPVEATSLGNVIVQAITIGHIENLAAGRALLRNSSRLECIEPLHTGKWDEAYARFENLLAH